MNPFFRTRQRFLTGLLCMGLASGLSQSAQANPSGPTVRHGQVNITAGVQAQIQQLTDQAIVDWQSFSIGSNESVQFLQPNQLSVILNRVTGGDASEILGQLTSNGNVFLINPNGILFGPNSTISVGGLVASSLNITDEDFLSGNYSFFQDTSRDLAAVVNQGKISVTDAGYAVLLAPTVINEGTIVARAGHIVLASGEQATLNLDGRDLVHFSLNGEVSDGTVLLAPGMMSDSIAQTLGVDSSRRADKFVQLADGSVRLASSSGTLVHTGTVSADGRDGVDAGRVLLDSADFTLLTDGSITSASGQGEMSSAGEIFILSDMEGETSGLTTVERGAVLAASGGESGDAGFIEVSGNVVRLRGEIDLNVSNGSGGSFLLDPGDVILVDDLFVDPMDANTYVYDSDIESMLSMMATVTIVSDGQAIISNITGTSGGTDLGINPDESGGPVFGQLILDTAGDGTFVDLGSDEFIWSGGMSIFSEADARLGSSTIQLGGGINVNAGGDITADGLSVDTRRVVGVDGDGGSVTFTADGNIDLDNSTIRYDSTGMGATLSLTTFNGTIEIGDSLLESDFIIPDPMNPVRLYVSEFIAFSSQDILIEDTDIFASNIDLGASGSITQTNSLTPHTMEASGIFSAFGDSVTLSNVGAGDRIDVTGDSLVDVQGAVLNANQVFLTSDSPGGFVDITDADIRTDQRPGSDPRIEITADVEILGDSSSLSGLHAATIVLSALTGPIEAVIDTSEDGNPGDSVPTALTVNAGGGVTIVDAATSGNALGVNLTRQSAGATAVSSNGDIYIESSGKIGLGSGDGVTTGDPGASPIVSAGGVNSNVTLISNDTIVDQTSTSAAQGGVEILATGSVTLEAPNGVGSFITFGEIDVDTNNLTVSVVGANAPINVNSNQNLDFIDVTFNGGAMLVTDTTGGSVQHQQVGAVGPNVLQMNQGGSTLGNNSVVRLTALSDVLIDNFDLLSDQQAILVLTNSADLLDGNTGSSDPNIDVQTGGAGYIAITSDGNLGTSTDFLSLRSDKVLLHGTGADSNFFLELRETTSMAPIELEGVVTGGASPDMVTAPLNTITGPEGLGVVHNQGDIVLEVTGDLGTPGGISTQGSLAIDAGTTGRVDTQDTPWDISDGTLLIQAGGLDGGLTQTFAESLGLSLTENLGADGSSAGIGSVESLVIGSTPDTAYFLDLNTEFGADVFLIDSLSVQNKTISGNQAETLHVENRTGDISVNAPLDVVDEVFLSAPDTVTSAMRPANVTVNAEINAGSRVHIQAANNIAQGTFGPNTGLLNTSETVLQAGGSIGAIGDDQLINADTLAASAGTNLYVRNVGPELEIVSDSDVASVGASNDFRVRSDFNDLTVSTDINATNIALVTGTELDIAPQVSPADVILNNNINATGGNLVIVATGDIVQNAGTLSANQLGLGSPGAVGTTGSPISFTANDLALFSNTNNLNPTSPPNSVPSVTSVGVSVFSGSPTTPPVTPPITPTEPPTNPPPQVPVPEGSVVVDVVLEPFRGLDEEFDPSVFAQNNVGLIDDELRTLLEIDILYDRLFDPTAIPIGWWNDDDFLKRKFRRKSKK